MLNSTGHSDYNIPAYGQVLGENITVFLKKKKERKKEKKEGKKMLYWGLQHGFYSFMKLWISQSKL